MACTASVTGAKTNTTMRMTGATPSAKPSGRISASVLGSTSEKITTAAVMAMVA
ncbi:hypothetical protein D3C73_1588500 [compost metagenome]